MSKDDKVLSERKFSYLGPKAEIVRKVHDISYQSDEYANSFDIEYRDTSMGQMQPLTSSVPQPMAARTSKKRQQSMKNQQRPQFNTSMPDVIPEADSSKSDESESKNTKMAIAVSNDVKSSEEE